MVHPAGSLCPLFTVEPLVPGSFSQHQDQCCPTRGAKMGEGLQLQLPKSTQVPGHDPRRTTINHYHRRHHLKAFTSPSRSHLGSSLPTLPAPSSSLAHTDPKSPRQAEPGAPGASESSSTRSWSICSSGAKKPQSVRYFPKQWSGAQQCATEIRACGVRGTQVEKEKEERKRRRRDGDVRRGETSSAVRCSIAHRGEERRGE